MIRFKKQTKQTHKTLAASRKKCSNNIKISSVKAASIRALKLELSSRSQGELFEQVNKRNYYFIKKSVRKILRAVKKYIQYSKKKETEIDLLLCFCCELKKMSPSMEENTALNNIYKHQIEAIKKTIYSLHEDLQFDYEIELNKIIE